MLRGGISGYTTNNLIAYVDTMSSLQIFEVTIHALRPRGLVCDALRQIASGLA